MIRLEQRTEGTVLPVRAQPGARRNAILGEHDGALRVAVTAAADKGRANAALVELLSKTFGIAKSSVELVSGPTSRQKRFLLRNVTIDSTSAVLDKLLDDDRN